MPNNPSSPHRRRPGAPLGNSNALKHGFYTRRIKKRGLSGVEATDFKNLVEEIAIIRVFTRRMVESCDPFADFYELAHTLRILCLASTAITRILRVHYLISGTENDLDRDIEATVLQVDAELTAKHSSPSLPDPAVNAVVAHSSASISQENIN